MKNNFDKILNYTVTKKLRSGEFKGVFSIILSRINILLLAFLLVNLIKNQQYLPALALVASQLWWFGFWVVLLFIYCILRGYIMGVYVLLSFLFINMLSLWYGRKYIKSRLLSNKSVINPLEGMFTMYFYLIIHVILFIIALLTTGLISAIFWFVFVVECLHEIHRHWIRLGSSWRGLHFPLMVNYGAIAAYYMRESKTIGKEFNFNEAMITLVKTAYPNMEVEEISLLIETANKELRRDIIHNQEKENLKKLDLLSDSSKNKDCVEDIENVTLIDDDNKYLLIYTIAEIIRKDYGDKERLIYLKSYRKGLVF